MPDGTLLLAGSGAVVVLLAGSAFFPSSEIAMVSVSPEWLSEQAGAGDERAASLDRLRSDPHRLLVTILVGNNVVTVATVVASALVLVCGEIVPKSYGLGNAESWSLRMVGPLAVVETLLSRPCSSSTV